MNSQRGGIVAAVGGLPNILTLLRIAAVPPLVWLLSYPTPTYSTIAFVVYVAASLTDYFDGHLARKHGIVTPLGKLLDPLADKLLVVSALIVLAMLDRQPGIPAWLVVLIVGRELAVTGLRSIAATEGIVLGADRTGKIKTVLQIVGIHALILHYSYYGFSFFYFGYGLLLLSAVAGVWSAVEYHLEVFRRMSAGESGAGKVSGADKVSGAGTQVDDA